MFLSVLYRGKNTNAPRSAQYIFYRGYFSDFKVACTRFCSVTGDRDINNITGVSCLPITVFNNPAKPEFTNTLPATMSDNMFRIRHKLDDDFPELSDAMLGVLYPHYLAPIPSLTILVGGLIGYWIGRRR